MTEMIETPKRCLNPVENKNGAFIYRSGKKYLDFSSNDYLGLSQHIHMIQAMKGAVESYGVGATGSRLLSGDSSKTHELEALLAEWHQKEAALVFNSGFQMNTGLFKMLCTKDDLIIADRLCHASLIDGALASDATLLRYRHNDTRHLAQVLEKNRPFYKQIMIVTESVFSMDGDIAPLEKIIILKEKHNATLLVDEAHALGVFGKNGGGIIEKLGVQNKVDYIVGTFGKALGSFGAFIALSNHMKEKAVNQCRAFIYSTALPIPVIVVNIASIKLVQKMKGVALNLQNMAKEFRTRLQKKGVKTYGESQIIPIIIEEEVRLHKIVQGLQNAGIWVNAIRPPTVPKGTSRLRISLTTQHTKEQLTALSQLITEYY